mgnify:FL=1
MYNEYFDVVIEIAHGDYYKAYGKRPCPLWGRHAQRIKDKLPHNPTDFKRQITQGIFSDTDGVKFSTEIRSSGSEESCVKCPDCHLAAYYWLSKVEEGIKKIPKFSALWA